MSRAFLRQVSAGIMIAFFLAIGGAHAAQRTYGLVIGIDKYLHQPLKGAVNDARDIADALHTIGADVTLLLDDDATRDAIFSAWKAILAKASPGDLVVVSYAGHGGQEPELVSRSEPDGKDETFILGGFTTAAPGNAQRIRDDEMNDLLRQASALTVLFIADSCHSGTMTRGVKRGSRFIDYGSIVDDQLPPPSPGTSRQAESGDLDHVIFYAGVADHLEVMEVVIDGQGRGALSYAIAGGLRGAADQDGDGGITRGELESYTRATVLSVTKGSQQLQVDAKLSPTTPLSAPRPFVLALSKADQIDPVAVQRSLPDRIAVTADGATAANLTWEVANGVMVGPDGLVVATLPPPSTPASAGSSPTRSVTRMPVSTVPTEWKVQIPAVVSIAAKWMLADWLAGTVRSRTLDIRLRPEAHVYRDSDKISLVVLLQQERYLTIFNIGPAGDVNFLYPLADYKDPPLVPENQDYTLSTNVRGPFGAEHFVAVATREQPVHLQALLQSMERERLTPESAGRLGAEIRASGGRVGVIRSTTGKKCDTLDCR